MSTISLFSNNLPDFFIIERQGLVTSSVTSPAPPARPEMTGWQVHDDPETSTRRLTRERSGR